MSQQTELFPWFCSQCNRVDHHDPECPLLVELLTDDERRRPMCSCDCATCNAARAA